MTSTNGTGGLALSEQLVLLSYRRDSRVRKAPAMNGAGSMDRAVQAALIIELIELGSVTVQPSPGAIARHTFELRRASRAPTGSATSDALLADIGSSHHGPRSLSTWLYSSALVPRVLGGLVDRGIVSLTTERVGLLGSARRVQPVDLQLDTAVRDHFESVFFDDGEASERDSLLAALIVDGFLADYFAPLRDRAAQLRFLARAGQLADIRRPPARSRALGEGDAVTLVLTALGYTNA